WSWGAVVALELAAARPDLIAALVLEEPAYDAKSNPTLGAIKALASAQILRRLRGNAAGAEAFLRWAVGRRTYERYPAARGGDVGGVRRGAAGGRQAGRRRHPRRGGRWRGRSARARAHRDGRMPGDLPARRAVRSGLREVDGPLAAGAARRRGEDDPRRRPR